MSTITRISLVAGVLFTAGCGANRSVTGMWCGNIAGQNQFTPVELELRSAGDGLEGTLTILNNTKGNITAGPSYRIINAHRRNNHIEFILSFTGELDSETVWFNLNIEDGRLMGFARKMQRGSGNIPVTFTRKN